MGCARFVFLTKRKDNKEAKKGSGARLNEQLKVPFNPKQPTNFFMQFIPFIYFFFSNCFVHLYFPSSLPLALLNNSSN